MLGNVPLPKKTAEWQSSGEKLSFQSRQVRGRILAKPELLPTGFFTLLQVGTQVAPALIIAGLKLLGREALLSRDDRSDHADGTAHNHAWNGSTSTCGSSLMNPCDTKAMFQIIIGTRQALHVIALKKASRKVVSDMAKMLNGLSERLHFGLLFLHLANVCQVAFTNLCPGVLLIIGQDLCRLVHQSIRALQWGPQHGGSLDSFGQNRLATALKRVATFFFLDPGNRVADLGDAIVQSETRRLQRGTAIVG